MIKKLWRWIWDLDNVYTQSDYYADMARLDYELYVLAREMQALMPKFKD